MTCRNILREITQSRLISETAFSMQHCFGFGSFWIVLETHSWRIKVPFMFQDSCSYRNDFAVIGLSDHSCRLPHLIPLLDSFVNIFREGFSVDEFAMPC